MPSMPAAAGRPAPDHPGAAALLTSHPGGTVAAPAPTTVIPAQAGIQVRPPIKNAEPPGPPVMADMTARAPDRPFIPVEANLDPRLRGDDGGGVWGEDGGGSA